MRILVIDDHKLFTDGLKFLLRQLAENIELIITNDSKSGLAEIESNPDFNLLLLDIHMPKSDGLSILRYIKQKKILIPTVIISATEDIHSIQLALNLGALGFVPKSYNGTELLDALRSVNDGNQYIPLSVLKKMNRLKEEQSEYIGEQKPYTQFGITKRQLDVLALMEKGYTNEKIADTLFLSKNTVKSHVTALLGSLQAENRTECVRLGRKHGILN